MHHCYLIALISFTESWVKTSVRTISPCLFSWVRLIYCEVLKEKVNCWKYRFTYLEKYGIKIYLHIYPFGWFGSTVLAVLSPAPCAPPPSSLAGQHMLKSFQRCTTGTLVYYCFYPKYVLALYQLLRRKLTIPARTKTYRYYFALWNCRKCSIFCSCVCVFYVIEFYQLLPKK